MNTLKHTLANDARRRACDYVMGAQDSDGFWRDYALPPGASSHWVTAVVGFALNDAGHLPEHVEALSRALSAVQSAHRASGWGYNSRVAPDADSTSWVIRWLIRTNSSLPLDPLSCLSAFLGPGGGARTFSCGPRYGSWTHEHVDVTAVLGLAMRESGVDALTLERIREWTLGQRNANGLWESFWWSFDGYANARVLEFLAATGGIPSDVFEATQRFVQTSAIQSATSMELANLLMLAVQTGVDPDQWLNTLLYSQLFDGSWPASRVLKVPNQKASSGSDPAFEDGKRLMSTAMAVMGLTAYSELFSSFS